MTCYVLKNLETLIPLIDFYYRNKDTLIKEIDPRMGPGSLLYTEAYMDRRPLTCENPRNCIGGSRSLGVSAK